MQDSLRAWTRTNFRLCLTTESLFLFRYLLFIETKCFGEKYKLRNYYLVPSQYNLEHNGAKSYNSWISHKTISAFKLLRTLIEDPAETSIEFPNVKGS